MGQGSFAVVEEFKEIKTGRSYAVKTIEPDILDNSDGIPTEVIREVSILRELNHPNIIRIVGIVNEIQHGVLSLVFDLMECDLRQFQRKFPLGIMDSHHVRNLMRQLLSGVAFCHERGVVHRDLKPDVGVSSSFLSLVLLFSN